MGVGATPADVDTMVANTSDKCAFACHIVNKGKEDKNSYYNLAKKLGCDHPHQCGCRRRPQA
jgi:hypothetical protein